MEPKIAVLTPVFNEEERISFMLDSLLKQSVKPSKVIIGNNDSTDRSLEIAQNILKPSGIDFSIINIKRYSELGKWNINNVYWHLNKTLEETSSNIDYVAVIESDVVIEKRYFEKLIPYFHKDPRLCITAGTLEPIGLNDDSFPLDKIKIMLWGSNRLYKGNHWLKLNNISDIRKLASWDFDHILLTLSMGNYVYPIPCAMSWTFRNVSYFRGIMKGVADAYHGLPFWWVIYKTVRKKDFSYFIGYLRTKSKIKESDPVSDELAKIYQYAALRTFKRKILVS
ncbi:MAG: glycosyltransferase family A protein [Nitrososphaeria archaeon]|jgi:glycosyltransferase involved in cell wall biosynthesis